MRTLSISSKTFILAAFCGLMYGQTTTTVSSVVSTYAMTTPSGFAGQVFSTLEITLYYPAGLSAPSYAPLNQLKSEFQGYLSSYPSPSDAPEAYLSGALQDILNKWPAIAFGELIATVTGPPQMIGGVTIPGTGTPIGSVEVAIGTYSSALFAGTTGVTTNSVTLSSVYSTWTVSMPSGFAGQSFSTLQLGVAYPAGLPSSSYITSKQLNSDFQGYISNYPTPADPPEAYLSGALQTILNKYTQMPAGVLGAAITGSPQTVGGTPIPGTGTRIGAIEVAIGNFTNVLGSLAYAYYGQSGNVASITSSWAVSMPSGFSGQTFSSVQLGVSYPTGLPANSYILSSQLNSDFQGLISNYPSPTDAAEAYLSVALQGILNKYSQMPGGDLTGQIAGQSTTVGGVPIPGAPAGSITVTIGTFNPLVSTVGLVGLLDRQATVDTVKPGAKSRVFPPRFH